MNLLLFTLEFPPFKGGVANYYDNVIKYWPKSDNIYVLNNNKNLLLKNYLYPKWLLSVYYLYKEIKNKKIDHVLVGQILPLGTAAYIIFKLTKKPYSVFIHGMDFAYSLKLKRKAKITKKILNKAIKIICVNSYVAELLNKTFNKEFEDKIHVVNPGIKKELIISNLEYGIKKIKENYDLYDKIILLSIGRLVKRKGFDKVIEAMPEILKSVPNIIYFIAGTGPDEKYLRRKSKDLNNVIFIGKINDDEKWAWLHSSDIFITVSRDIEGDFEGFGIVYLEANLVGKPVIAGNSGGVKDAVVNNYNGILIDDPVDKEEIANGVIKLVRDEKLRKKLGEQGRERAIKDFQWLKQVKKIYEAIN
jgi:phosphatidylinositol alpha-1,6-mannosyltransferase